MQDDSAPNKGGHAKRESCHYLPDMVVVPIDESNRARNTLDRLGINAGEWGTGDLLELLEGLQEQDIASLGERLDLIRLIGEDGGRIDPHETARILRTAGGVRASVVHGLGHMGHARAMSGEGPDKSDGKVQGDPVDESAPIIAVVDTGIVDERGRKPWDWMLAPSVEADPQDHEVANSASHGTYVVSLIRQERADRAVWLAAARPRLMVTDAASHHDDEPLPTTELDVVAALARLRRRLRQSRGREIAALNLSLGAHSDRPCEDDFLLAVKLALAAWLEDLGPMPIWAAGGNSTDPAPVYPAAFESVVGVGALDENGDEIVWDPAAGRTKAPLRYWVEATAKGVGTTGLSGNPAQPVITWGGSSFATALHTARNAP